MTTGELKKRTQELLDKMGFYLLHAPEVSEKEGRFFIDIFVDDPRALIGERGVNLRALQHIVRLLARKNSDSQLQIDIDVNGYKRKRVEFLSDIALSARKRALEEKRNIEIEPMNAFDRRAIHSALGGFDDVETESTGEGLERRIVVKLKN
jgi:spoIIIJ-associated protein